jgi:hypothetical protein
MMSIATVAAHGVGGGMGLVTCKRQRQDQHNSSSSRVTTGPMTHIDK